MYRPFGRTEAAIDEYPPYEKPNMAMRPFCAMPWSIIHLAPSSLSSCIFWPHSASPAIQSLRPQPCEPRNCGRSTAKHREAMSGTHIEPSKPISSRDHGPPWGWTTAGQGAGPQSSAFGW